MSTLPADFRFSQGSLQDYVDCPRRFQLRYVLRLAWPAIEAEPALENERHMQQGAAFHRLIHQHVLGIPVDRLSSSVDDEDLGGWWRNYLAKAPADLPSRRFAEIVLSAPLAGHQLMAKYDLVAIDPGHSVVIIDWKTSHHRPPRPWLAGRLQTRVYPYLAVRAGSALDDGRPLEAEQVKMVYWFASFPDDPESFSYGAAQLQADEVYLTSLIDEIKNRGSGDYSLTSQEKHCQYCPYRSLCGRGLAAGLVQVMETEAWPGDDTEISFDFEQIAEIEY